MGHHRTQFKIWGIKSSECEGFNGKWECSVCRQQVPAPAATKATQNIYSNIARHRRHWRPSVILSTGLLLPARLKDRYNLVICFRLTSITTRSVISKSSPPHFTRDYLCFFNGWWPERISCHRVHVSSGWSFFPCTFCMSVHSYLRLSIAVSD